MATRILVVDDSLMDRSLVSGLLSKHSDWAIDTAESGREALEKIENVSPDLIVSDLVMPEMNGLQLLRAVRAHHPDLPVILLTAHGNESIAVEALQAGAASYVPKAKQAERLRETVERVLEHAEADRHRGLLDSCILEYQWRVALENSPALIRIFVGQVQQKMASVRFGDASERIRVSEALEEALLNAMYHGNLEISESELDAARADLAGNSLERLTQLRKLQPRCQERKILAIVRVSPTDIRVVIRDEGNGFNVGALVNQDPYAFEHGKRRGLTLIQSMMDEVTFNKAGNELTMCKRRITPYTAHQMQQDAVRTKQQPSN